MPLYEYQCAECGRFELIQRFADGPLTTCPTCGSEVQKLPSAPAIQFKGTGWYITDYARKGKSGESESRSDDKSDSSKSDSSKSDKAGDKQGKSESSKSTSTDATSTSSTATSQDTSASAPGSSAAK